MIGGVSKDDDCYEETGMIDAEGESDCDCEIDLNEINYWDKCRLKSEI